MTKQRIASINLYLIVMMRAEAVAMIGVDEGEEPLFPESLAP